VRIIINDEVITFLELDCFVVLPVIKEMGRAVKPSPSGIAYLWMTG
jgi:hypothetical protein